MAEVNIGEVTIAYDVFGEGEPVVLVCGCGQPALAWQLELVPALVAAGYQVVTFDNRGVAPSSSPPPPYSVDDLVADTLGLLDHLGHGVGPGGRLLDGRMGGRDHGHPPSGSGAGRRLHRQLQRGHGVGEGHHHRRARSGPARLPAAPLFYATETLRYLPNHDLQDDDRGRRVAAMIGDLPEWPNPGDWASTRPLWPGPSISSGPGRGPRSSVPCLVLAFEHDVDSPPGPGPRGGRPHPGSPLRRDRRGQPPRGVHPRLGRGRGAGRLLLAAVGDPVREKNRPREGRFFTFGLPDGYGGAQSGYTKLHMPPPGIPTVTGRSNMPIKLFFAGSPAGRAVGRAAGRLVPPAPPPTGENGAASGPHHRFGRPLRSGGRLSLTSHGRIFSVAIDPVEVGGHVQVGRSTDIRRSIDALGRGDIGPTFAGYADDAVLVFPGQGSRWSGEHRGKRAIQTFLRSFLDAGIVGEADDILVNGPPLGGRQSVSCSADRAPQGCWRHRLREPGHPVRPGGLGARSSTTRTSRTPGSEAFGSLSGRTVVGDGHVKGSGASPVFIISVARAEGLPVATGGPLLGVTLSDRQWDPNLNQAPLFRHAYPRRRRCRCHRPEVRSPTRSPRSVDGPGCDRWRPPRCCRPVTFDLATSSRWSGRVPRQELAPTGAGRGRRQGRDSHRRRGILMP